MLLSLTKLSAQSNTVAVGGELTGSGGTASITAGEVFYTYKSSASGSATEGMQQSYLALPTAVISGDATVCAGSSTQLSIALTGQGPWSGTLSDGTVFSGSDNPLLVSVTPTMTTTYTVATLSNQTDTASAADLIGSATVMVYAAPSIEAVSPSNGTSGSTITIAGANFDGAVAPTVTIEAFQCKSLALL